MNPSPYAIRKAIELLENSDNYLNNGFERAITTLIAAASRVEEIQSEYEALDRLMGEVMRKAEIDWDGLYKIMRRIYKDPYDRSALEQWLYKNDPRKAGNSE